MRLPLPLFCDTPLAGRIERAEAQMAAEASEAARRRGADTAGFVIPITCGVARFAEQDSPLNKVVGLGSGAVPGATALEEIERAYAACGAPVQIELAHLTDPAIGALLDRARLPAHLVAGGAFVRIAEGLAQFAGAATAPAHRRRVCRPHYCRPGSPTPRPPAATSPSSPRCRDPSLSRTRSGKASTCSTLALSC